MGKKNILLKVAFYFKERYIRIKKLPSYIYFKRKYLKNRNRIIKRFLSYTPTQLEKKLREIGISTADTVVMHSSFKESNGFSGGPYQVIECILNVIGKAGNLLMVSLPYTGSTAEYLKAVGTFDVKRTISSMGIISEIFRRKKDVFRSLNPAHPILAFGSDAKWIISNHDKISYSCGKGSPFEKILKFNAKVLFFDVPFDTMTFTHYLEDSLKDFAPFKLYEDEPIESTVIDAKGKRIKVKTYVFSKETIENRNDRLLEKALKKRQILKTDRIGNTKLMFANLKEVVACSRELVKLGMHF